MKNLGGGKLLQNKTKIVVIVLQNKKIKIVLRKFDDVSTLP